MSFALAFFLVYQLACIGLVMWCRVARSRSRPWVVIDVPVVMLPSYLMVFCLSRPCLPRLMHSTMQCVRYRLGLPAGSLSNRGLGGSSPQPGRVISPPPLPSLGERCGSWVQIWERRRHIILVDYKYILKCPKSIVVVLGFAYVFQIQLPLDLFHTVTYMMQLHRKPGNASHSQNGQSSPC
jgi:hypothetical protein